MNTPNNKRKKNSQEKIKKVLFNLIQDRNINEITVTDICKEAEINRSTFYANYIDIYDLVDKIKDDMMSDFLKIYKEECILEKHSYNFLKLFYHIKDNQLFYKSYFKLNFDYNWNDSYLIDEMLKWYGTVENMEYHVAFFKAGLNAVLIKWLENNCKESPEEIETIIKDEYKNRIVV